jgi:hypothetical protein
MNNTQEAIEKYTEAMKKHRQTWGPGRWKKEPDRVEFRAHGFDCMIIRAPLGNLCGYVGLPPEHPLHGQHYNDLPESIDVHGGVTYTEECGGHICHIPREGEPDHLFWVGFDCAHGNDLLPSSTSALQLKIAADVEREMQRRYPGYDRIKERSLLWGRTTYKPVNWVMMETKRLARQLRRLAAENPVAS